MKFGQNQFKLKHEIEEKDEYKMLIDILNANFITEDVYEVRTYDI